MTLKPIYQPRLFWAVALLLASGWILLAPHAGPVQADDISASSFRNFQLVSENDAWLLFDNRLYWKQFNVEGWQDITPAAIGDAIIQTGWFINRQAGWLMLTTLESDGSLSYILAQTSDGGLSWELHPLSLFAAADPRANASALHLQFTDDHTGWLEVRQATSSNFNLGTLFATQDGGLTWQERSIPIGEPVYFVNEQLGWTVGGAGESRLYRTVDGGLSWNAQSVVDEAGQPAYQLPVFENDLSGVLPVLLAGSEDILAQFYTTQDGGGSWQLADMTSLDVSSDNRASVFATATDVFNWQLFSPSSGQAWQISSGAKTQFTLSGDPALSNIVSLQMKSPQTGLAKSVSSECASTVAETDPAREVGSTDCLSRTSLLVTTDGGQIWTALALPNDKRVIETGFTADYAIVPPDKNQPEGAVAATGRMQIFTGQGFDSCTMPSVSQMQTWYNSSPYRVWNLYFGGSSRGACGTLTTAYLSQLSQQGWRFIPTWVGPQASCSGFPNRMSSDAGTAYTQGVAEANLAVTTAANLGLTLSDNSGAIIYYDLESYNTSDTGCRQAAASFINGWTGQLRSRGNTVGVYGSPCSSALSDFVSAANVPDAVWIAAWLTPYQYRSDASVFNVSCLSNTLWAADQRLRQYAGGHNETWGSVTINIDSNVLDGPVVNLNPCPQSGGVILYFHLNQDCNGQGENSGYVVRTSTGWQNISGSMNNNASSVYIPSGQSVRLFENADRNANGGGSTCINAGQAGTQNFTLLPGYPGTSTGVNDTASSFEVLSVTCPAYDDLGGATQITTLPYIQTLDVSNTTPYQDDPALTACNRNPGQATVWYRYTPGLNGQLQVDTIGSNYNTMLAIWTGSRGNLQAVACNDDVNGGQQSSLQTLVTAGTTYYIEAAQYNGTLANPNPPINTLNRSLTLRVQLVSTTALANSILPTSRTTTVGNTVTVYNTVINGGVITADDVTLAMANPPPGTFKYRQSNCANNDLIGPDNPVLDIPAGGIVCYVLSFTPSATFSATEVHIKAQAVNAPATSVLTGINTWLLRATSNPSPDIIALSTTADFHQVACNGSQNFAVATANVGAAASPITVTADFGSQPLNILINETNPATGAVIGDNVLENVASGEFRSVLIQVTFNGCIPFDPATRRIFIRFRDSAGNIVGSTSTAVSTNR